MSSHYSNHDNYSRGNSTNDSNQNVENQRNLIRQQLINVNYDSSQFLDHFFNPILLSLSNELSSSTHDIITSSSATSNYSPSTLGPSSAPKIENSELYLRDTLDLITKAISDFARDIENNITIIQRRAIDADTNIAAELDKQIAKLSKIEGSSNTLQTNFLKSSENAVKIGERLTVADHERNRLNDAIDLLNFIQYFEDVGKNASQGEIEQILSKSVDQVRSYFPESIRNSDIGQLAEILHDLRRILNDINSEEVQHAQAVVFKLSEAIENELLHIFELTFTELVSSSTTKDKAKILKDCQNLVEWLHYFNNGLSVQKKYIFTVVSQRIPSNLINRTTVSTSTWKKLASVLSRNNKDKDDADDESSAGATSDDEDVNNSELGASTHSKLNIVSTITSTIQSTIAFPDSSNYNNSYNNNSNSSNINVTDQLSELFGTISSVCQEQFTVIRMVFPPNTVARITRLLIQRIFNDPLFGIQIRVDAVLSPRPPKPPLSLGEFIDALVLVRQKLSSLYILLLEYCIHPEVMGFLEKTQINNSTVESETVGSPDETNRSATTQGVKTLFEDDEDEKAKAEADVKEFLEEQISQVLTTYINDYFDNKEMLHLKAQFVDNLRKAVDSGASGNANSSNIILSKIQYSNSKSSTAVQAGSILTLPKLRAEKLRSIGVILKTVANKKYFTGVFNTVLDSLYRITVIERDDKKLSAYFKEVFLTLLGFLIDGLLVPICQASTLILLKFSSASATNANIPPIEYLDLLSVVYWTVTKLNTFFSESFIKILSNTTKELSKTNNVSQNAMNTITICKESKRRSLRSLEKVSRESLHAWTLCIGLFVDKTLVNTQIKNDYNPKAFDPTLAAASVANTASNVASTAVAKVSAITKGQNPNDIEFSTRESKTTNVEPTTACDTICRALLEIANEIRQHSEDISGINLYENFWIPLGRQIIGSIISHLRRQKISPEGAKVVMRDLNEYYNTMVLFEAPENIDMMLCLKDITSVYLADAEDVPKIVIEGLRHLDTAVVLALVKARTDFNKGSASWVKRLIAAYGSLKWDSPLPWEVKKNMTIVAFAESAAAGSNSQALGPSTLRKNSGPITSYMMSEFTKGQGIDSTLSNGTDNNNTVTGGIGFSDSNSVSLPSMEPSSSFAPSRPEDIIQPNQLLTTFGNNDSMPSVPSIQSSNDTLNFVNRNTILNSVDGKQTKGSNGSISGPMNGPLNGMKNIMHKVQDQASHARESAAHLVANVKHAVEHPGGLHSGSNNTTTTTTTTATPRSSTTSSAGGGKFDKDMVSNIFTSPKTGQSVVDPSSKSSTNSGSNTSTGGVMDKMSSLFKRSDKTY